MRVIGIDPGTVCCGYGIIETGGEGLTGRNRRGRRDEAVYVTAGEIRMSRKEQLPVRLLSLYRSLKEIFTEYRPAQVCVEKIFYHKSIRSAFTLGSTRGIALLLAAEHSVPVFEYNPTEAKMAITGFGRAEKPQVKEMVMRILHLDPGEISLSEDSSDALALCICHVHTQRTRTLQARVGPNRDA